ncbi:MAG: orotidine-5'-phosphate decarboxylase [bacterium]
MEPDKTGIMFAADLPDKKKTFQILDKIIDDIEVIKFNYPLILNTGIEMLRETKNRYQKPIFADFKVADVPVTNNRIINLCRENNADAVMIHGFVGIDALREARETATDIQLFLMTQLTNPGGLDFYEPYSEKFAEIARTLDFDGVQAPGNRPEAVRKTREIVGEDLIIVSCGIGAQGGRFGGAIEAGANYEIIGRAIYQAEDPAKKVKEINKKIESRLN